MALIPPLQQSNITTGSGGSLTVTLGSGSTAGNLLIAHVVSLNFVSSIGVPSNWLSIQKANGSSWNMCLGYYVNNAGGLSSFHFTGSGQMLGWVGEYSGIATSSALDKSGSNSGVSSNASVTISATTQATELWVGGAGTVSGSSSFGTPNNGYTKEKSGSSSSLSLAVLDESASATGAASFTISVGSSIGFVAIGATFKASGGGGATLFGSTLSLMGVG